MTSIQRNRNLSANHSSGGGSPSIVFSNQETSAEYGKGGCKKVLLFGRLPARGEVGGVITFTQNLSKENKDLIDSIVDFYPSENKIKPDGVHVEMITGSFLIRICKLFLLHFQSHTLFHHNFSTVRGLLPLALFPKLMGSKWMLTLHHGELKNSYNQLGFFSRAIVGLCLKRVDTICSISEKQDAFFAGFTQKKKYRVSPFVKMENNDVGIVEHNPASEITQPTFLIAGYPTKIYRHLETIRIFHELWESGSRFCLNVCLYGQDTDRIRDEIEDAVFQSPFTELHTDLDATSFQELLKNSDVYVRMNTIDSYGLVCAEAAQHGLTTIATNVCARFPGTFLLEKDDFSLLKSAISAILRRENLSGFLQVEREERDSVSFRSLYQSHIAKQAA